MRTFRPKHVVMVFAYIWAVAIFAATGVANAERPPQTNPQAIQTLDGRAIFTSYCASCHGVSGTGNGPAARSMRRTPPDVTRLAAANGGVFPIERVRRIVDGREIEAHGDRDMPVWGDAFKAMLGGLSEEAVRARITAILEYLESIQRRQA